jgi:hypothetical protein
MVEILRLITITVLIIFIIKTVWDLINTDPFEYH